MWEDKRRQLLMIWVALVGYADSRSVDVVLVETLFTDKLLNTLRLQMTMPSTCFNAYFCKHVSVTDC